MLGLIGEQIAFLENDKNDTKRTICQGFRNSKMVEFYAIFCHSTCTPACDIFVWICALKMDKLIRNAMEMKSKWSGNGVEMEWEWREIEVGKE